MKNKKAFTLIELIVVIAVIAILVVLAMPRFMGRAREAKITQAVSDSKVFENAMDEFLLRHDTIGDNLGDPVTVESLQAIADDGSLVDRKGLIETVTEDVYYKATDNFIQDVLNVRNPAKDDVYVTNDGYVVIDIKNSGAATSPKPDGSGDAGGEENEEGNLEGSSNGYFDINSEGVITQFYPEGKEGGLELWDSGDLIIPDTVDGIVVTGIDNFVFNNSVHPSYTLDYDLVGFPDTLKSIGEYAFLSTEIGTLNLNEGLTTIDSGAFGSSKIKGELTLPNSLEIIGDSAFANNEIFGTLSIPEGLIEIGGWAFNKNPLITQLIIPEGSKLEVLGKSSFNRSPLEGDIFIPGTVKEIGAHAFSRHRFNEIKISEGVERIGASAFANGGGWTSTFTLPSTLIEIEEGALNMEVSMTKLTLPENLERIGDYAFRGIEVEFNDKLTTIGANAFREMPHIKELTIPANIQEIGHGAFSSAEHWSQECLSRVIFEGEVTVSGNPTDEHDEGLFPKNITTLDGEDWVGYHWAGILPDENGKVSGTWNWNYTDKLWEKED